MLCPEVISTKSIPNGLISQKLLQGTALPIKCWYCSYSIGGRVHNLHLSQYFDKFRVSGGRTITSINTLPCISTNADHIGKHSLACDLDQCLTHWESRPMCVTHREARPMLDTSGGIANTICKSTNALQASGRRLHYIIDHQMIDVILTNIHVHLPIFQMIQLPRVYTCAFHNLSRPQHHVIVICTAHCQACIVMHVTSCSTCKFVNIYHIVYSEHLNYRCVHACKHCKPRSISTCMSLTSMFLYTCMYTKKHSIGVMEIVNQSIYGYVHACQFSIDIKSLAQSHTCMATCKECKPAIHVCNKTVDDQVHMCMSTIASMHTQQ